MTTSTAPQAHSSGDTATKVIARLMAGAILIVLVGHVAYFVAGISLAPVETFYGCRTKISTLYGDLLCVFQFSVQEPEHLARGFSLLCTIGAVMALRHVATNWSNDPVVGAAITIGFVLFPVSAYAFSLAIPVALTALVSILAISLVTSTETTQPLLRATIVASLLGALPFLDASGAGLAIATGVVFVATHGNVATRAVFAGVAALTFVVLAQFYSLSITFNDSFHSVNGFSATFVAGLLKTYAMLWVGLLSSIFALVFSAALRRRMGRELVHRTVTMMIAFAIALIWFVGVKPGHMDREIAFNGILIFGVLASLPMVLWLRWIMPSIQSVWIWILLPVVMYSCFWVVLGPIDWAGFPYDQVVSSY